MENVIREKLCGILDTELDDSIAIASARKAYRSAREEMERSLAAFYVDCRQFLNSSSSEAELAERAAYLYWNEPDVPSSLMAEIVTGKEGNVNKLLKMIPPRKTIVECSECGEEFLKQFQSRTALIVALKPPDPRGRTLGRPICDSCQAAHENRQLARAEFYEQQLNRTEELATMPYREYLLSPEWKEVRMHKLRQACFRCQLCNAGGRLDVHHRTYERRGHEWMSDLIALCRDCHGKFHDKL